MPSDTVNIVSVQRLEHPELLRTFCREEQESLAREREKQRNHKEFMFLHGTRWENVSSVRENGLDPDCGHLGRGIWLGQNAEAVHTYAAKGPGPEQADGRRLFAMFVAACLPSHFEGDEERSFGVWRIMSGCRMYPAYLVIYAAPLDVRVKRPFPSPRMNRSVQILMQWRTSMDEELRNQQSPRGLQNNPQSPRGSTGSLKCPPGLQSSVQSPRALPCAQKTMTRVKSEERKLQQSRISNQGVRTPGTPRTPRTPGTPRLLIPSHSRDKSADGMQRQPLVRCHASQESLVSGKVHLPSTSNVLAHCRSGEILRQAEACDGTSSGLEDSFVIEPVRQMPFRRNSSTTHCKSAPVEKSDAKSGSKWEVQLDERWTPFCPGAKFNDQPGSQQDLCYRNTWYKLAFDVNGTTGTQTNSSTRKTRLLRRVPLEPEANAIEVNTSICPI